MKVKPHPQLTKVQNDQIQRIADDLEQLWTINPKAARTIERLIRVMYEAAVKGVSKADIAAFRAARLTKPKRTRTHR